MTQRPCDEMSTFVAQVRESRHSAAWDSADGAAPPTETLALDYPETGWVEPQRHGRRRKPRVLAARAVRWGLPWWSHDAECQRCSALIYAPGVGAGRRLLDDAAFKR